MAETAAIGLAEMASGVSAAEVGGMTATVAEMNTFNAVAGGAMSAFNGLSSVGTIFSTIGTIGQMGMGILNGQNQADFYSSQAEFQQQQFQLQQQSIATQASQDEVIRRRQLGGILASQQAMAAAHGMDVSSSASLSAAEQGSITQAESDISASKTSAANRELMTNLQASQAALTNSFKEAQGYGEIAGSIFTGGTKLAETAITVAQKPKSNNLTG